MKRTDLSVSRARRGVQNAVPVAPPFSRTQVGLGELIADTEDEYVGTWPFVWLIT